MQKSKVINEKEEPVSHYGILGEIRLGNWLTFACTEDSQKNHTPALSIIKDGVFETELPEVSNKLFHK